MRVTHPDGRRRAQRDPGRCAADGAVRSDRRRAAGGGLALTRWVGLVWWLAVAALAQEGPAVLAGRVSLVGMLPESVPSRQGVTVELDSHATGETVSTTTGNDGGFRFEGVPPGQYDLLAFRSGGYGATQLVELRPGEVATVSLRLATRQMTWLLTAVWVAMAGLLALVFAAAMLLYGPGRVRRDRSAPRSLTVAFLLWLAAFWLFSLLSPELQPCRMEVADTVSSLLAIVVAGCVVLVVVLLQPPWQAATGAIVAGLLLTVSAATVSGPGPWAPAAIGIGLLLWTSAAGWLLATWLKRRSYVVLTAWVIALIDLYQVFLGSTGQVVSGQAAGFDFIRSIGLLPWPLLGSDVIVPRVGYADFLFLAWFLGAGLRFELGLTRTWWTLMAALTIGVVMSQVMFLVADLSVGLPALPFMSALFLLVNRQEFTLTPAERRQVVGFVGGLCLVLAGLGLVQQRRQGVEHEDLTLQRVQPEGSELTPPWSWEADAAPVPMREVSRVAFGTGGLERLGLEFEAPPVAGRPVIIRGWLGLPRSRPAAAVLQLPGLRHEADSGWVERMAAAGRVALSIDLCPETGPGLQSDLAAWPMSDYDAFPSVERSRLYHAGVAAFRALAILAARPEVGGGLTVTGDGWGGLLALACGVQASPVTAVAVSQIGAVEGDDGLVAQQLRRQGEQAQAAWLRCFAPERYAARLRGPLLVLASSNDRFFTLPGVVQLAAAATGAAGDLIVEPNADHAPSRASQARLERWVVRSGESAERPPTASVTATAVGPRLTFAVSRPPAAGASGPAGDEVTPACYVSVGPRGWPGRFWQRLPMRPRGQGWSAVCEVAGPVSEASVLVDLPGPQGEGGSRFQTFDLNDLGLTVLPAGPAWAIGWPPVPGRVWRSTADERGRVTPDPGEPVGVGEAGLEMLRLESPSPTGRVWRIGTNDVESVRQLGAVSRAIEVEVAGALTGEVSLGLVASSGRPEQLRWAVPGALRAPGPEGWRRVVFPLQSLQRPGPRQVGDWQSLDTVELELQTDRPGGLRIRGVRLLGWPGGPVRPARLEAGE